jgi:hypothetical protein
MKFVARSIALSLCLMLCVVGAICARKDSASKPALQPEPTRVLNEQTQHRSWLRV